LFGFVIFTALAAPTFAAAADGQAGPATEQFISQYRIFSWEKMNGAEVLEAGMTIPSAIVANPPRQPGKGPAGAIAVIGFPKIVEDTTCLNHFELNWESHGHEPQVFMHPHFDFHFYGVPVAEVMHVSIPDPSPPSAESIPAGYAYPGPEFAVPQMGVHAVRPADLEKPFTDVLILGFYGGHMTFIEPVATRARLLQRQPITYAIPVPPVMGRITRYPTKFRLVYDLEAEAWHLIFSDFVTTSA
jgi:hypothetical protein